MQGMAQPPSLLSPQTIEVCTTRQLSTALDSSQPSATPAIDHAARVSLPQPLAPPPSIETAAAALPPAAAAAAAAVAAAAALTCSTQGEG